ncbi:MAG: UbiX family flavin prenyltransferase [Promethearchaeota archaeon]
MLVAITGATGVNFAVKFLKKLKEKDIKIELIISKVAEKIINIETDYNISDIHKLADKSYNVDDLLSPPASGSYKIESMVIIPCSMKTLSAVANGYANNLISRAADVMIKEKRKLLLVVRETPFSVIHLENMLKLARLGVIICPPIPSYYMKPKNIDELMEYTIDRILDQIGIDSNINRWGSI